MLVYFLLVALATQSFCAPTGHNISKRQIFNPFTIDFARPPTGAYAGGLGGAFGSPIFGPPLTGPFNNPILREERIMELFDHNRRVNGRPVMSDQFSLGDVDLGFDMSEPLPGLRPGNRPGPRPGPGRRNNRPNNGRRDF
ncbi:unnamed protein product [Brachionus calyciflorus]|uniref:Secreted protein n=1 Tax=Brachionus calyciflorus TaxID=104777 RepID=A0A813P6V5_9BILA|nr:unnamed protein product [Brachionus calyciflorus]